MSIKQGCIILFVKSPEQTPVKSRLAASLGAETARALYRNFVLDMLETLTDFTAAAGYGLRICFAPPRAGRALKKWLGNTYTYLPQQGRHLGERMKNAFLAGFAAGYQRVLLLGSDTPDLTGTVIAEGMRSLLHHHAVIGPARDGGYYLLGFRAETFLPAVFQGIVWSGGDVFDRTLAIFRGAGVRVAILPPWRDIDTVADLRDLHRTGLQGSFAQSRTMRYLRSNDSTKLEFYDKGK